MSTIAIELDDPADTVRRLRSYRDRPTLCSVADRIEAAIPKRIIVLDVDELDMDAGALRVAAGQHPSNSRWNLLLNYLADALDNLTPSRPWAVGGTVIMVDDDVAYRSDAGTWKCTCGQTHDDEQMASDLERKRARIVEDGGAS